MKQKYKIEFFQERNFEFLYDENDENDSNLL